MDSFTIAFYAVAIGFGGWVVFLLFRGEEVGEVEGAAGPEGIDAVRCRLRVMRDRGRSRHPRFRLLSTGPDGVTGRFYDRPTGLRLAVLLEGAARMALDSAIPADPKLGSERGTAVGMVRQRDGMGWVTVGWLSDGFGDRTCLGPGDALHLAEVIRIACQPGATLHAAQRSWEREHERGEDHVSTQS